MRQVGLLGTSLRIHVAERFPARARGLIGRALGEEEGMLLIPCSAVHTFGMRYAIDVVFLDDANRIRAIFPALPPWRLAASPGSRAVLELRAGAAARHGLVRGQQAHFIPLGPERRSP